MTMWLVEYFPCVKFDPDTPELGEEIPCFRIYPEGEPERWIVQTNGNLPREVQEEVALIIADALSKALG
jgi:hypothetical protein